MKISQDGKIKIDGEKITFKRNTILSVDELTDLIINHVKQTELLLSLKDTTIDAIPMCVVEREFATKIPDTYKAGDVIKFKATHPHPVLLAQAEAVYNICNKPEGPYKFIKEGDMSDLMKEEFKKNDHYVRKLHKLDTQEGFRPEGEQT